MASDNHQVDSIRLDGKNYAYWAHLMKNFFDSADTLANCFQQYRETHSHGRKMGIQVGKINSWLANFVDPTIGFQLAKFAHPKDAWDYLARLYVHNNLAE